MKQYLCLSNSPWQSTPTRTQQLMTRMKDAQVLFFEPPAHGSSKAHKKPGRRVRPGLTVYTLPPVLEMEERRTLLQRRGQKKLARYIESKAAQHRFREPTLWCTSPEHVHLLDLLAYRGLVYDCDRDFSELPIRWESDLALACDLIFAASPWLREHLAPCNDNIALLPNGVNYPMFAQSGLPCPPALSGLRRPILGWAGTIRRDLDLTPALYAAQTLSDCSFVFLGAREENIGAEALERLPNVYFLGQRPSVEVPDYLSQCDVCLHFLQARDVGSDIIPVRLYEYLSTGAPIVSMLYEDQVEPFPDVVYGAHSAAEFTQLCARALTEAGDWARSRRREYGCAAAWSNRADEVSRILESIGLM